MSCRKAYEIDLAGFVADPTGAQWAEFRDHYPRCAACASEVRTWTELHLALGSASHPDPADLVRYVDDAVGLAPAARHAIAEHLTACAACRDEAHTLRSFDPLASPAREPAPKRWVLLPAFRGAVWHPAFAYAVALVAVLYPVLAERVTMQSALLERAKTAHEGGAKPALDDDETAPAAPSRQPAAPAAQAPAPGPEQRQLRKEADAPSRDLRALGYLAGGGRPDADDKLEAGTRAPAAPVARNDEVPMAKARAGEPSTSRPVPEVVVPAAESTISIPPGATDVILRVEDASGATECTLGDAQGKTIFVARRDPRTSGRDERPAFRMPASVLLPGRYTLAFTPGDGSRRRVRVVAP
jgi:hypothetical protein